MFAPPLSPAPIFSVIVLWLILHDFPLMAVLWTHALSLLSPAAPHLRWIRFLFPPLLAGSCRVVEGGKGPLASPLQAGLVWHEHCSIITAKSHWWKTLGPLRWAISINIYTGVAGNRMKPSFQRLWGETEAMRRNLMQIADVKAHRDVSAQECDMKRYFLNCSWYIPWI